MDPRFLFCIFIHLWLEATVLLEEHKGRAGKLRENSRTAYRSRHFRCDFRYYHSLDVDTGGVFDLVALIYPVYATDNLLGLALENVNYEKAGSGWYLSFWRTVGPLYHWIYMELSFG